MEGGAMLNDASQIPHHRTITEAVHQEGGKIALQILHTGRYSYQPHLVAPSALQAPINRFVPHELSHEEILQLIDNFARCAQLAREAGYDGVEVMGSEGYLINEFLTLRTNQRSDQWGGDYRNRMRFAVEVVRAVRERVGNDFIIIYRLSMLDLVEDGGTFAETVEKIVGLLNEAINSNLAWKAEKADDGRMTMAGAMALKFKVLQWAASPTFNSNTKWHPEADEYTCYGNYSDQRWKDAAEAGAAFFTELQKRHEYELIQPTEETHRARRLAYRQMI